MPKNTDSNFKVHFDAIVSNEHSFFIEKTLIAIQIANRADKPSYLSNVSRSCTNIICGLQWLPRIQMVNRPKQF